MNDSFVMDFPEFQQLMNDTKDAVISRINKDYGLSIDPCEYLYVLQQRGCLGRAWDKLLGKETDGTARTTLIRVKLDDKKPTSEVD